MNIEVTPIVPGTAAISRRRQSMKIQVDMNHRPTADFSTCPRRR